jgi:cytochrome P450
VAKEIITRTVTEGNLSEPETAFFLGSLVGAAFDTTQVAISTIMMAAARFPEAQAVVHAQLDTVVGRDAREFLRLTFLGDKSCHDLDSADVCGMDVAH